MASTCQPFQERTQHAPVQHDGCVLPSVYRGMALQQASSLASPPASAPERSSSSSGRSVTEVRAMKIHSEAEKRRRERINAHVGTLRRMIPDTNQIDKATVLASVINQLKDLKRKASQATQSTPIPAEENNIIVNCYTGDAIVGDDGTVYIQASISCDDRPGLLTDIAMAFRSLRLRAMSADMASLGGRMQCSFVLCQEGGDVNLTKPFEEAVRQALASAAFSEMVHGCSSSRSKRQRNLESCFL